MVDNNKFNILYFENDSMKTLYESMDSWQKENKKRFHTITVNEDNNQFCCIALTNPTEVIIVNGAGKGGVRVENKKLSVKNT